jgi:hypothetical protein
MDDILQYIATIKTVYITQLPSPLAVPYHHP